MANRREFSKRVRIEIIKRSMRGNTFYCEQCGLPAKKLEVHHRKEDFLETDKSCKLTAEDGIALCQDCHRAEHKGFGAVVSKVVNREASHLGAKPPPKTKIQSRGFVKKTRTHADRGAAFGVSELSRRFREG